ncbi:hypothetical protein COW36_07695 [bacterium (Candidatus Blackallbacteria) CG17_big_fil_post_rev_8_21_14_2_50_48_46]|uniref:Uncharacterized protein n=1 Tax=bacterium (Candidatus Blackallbacteria) CG17_big_fil_post_rev_8_21_14_2_50_48_46 TaxID=2014261 RepID=A0A2M7G6P8_9BACT|nr:MAG: hypothetical protein COW64_06400 [bacterium (Candidatus Blackallbacteria) CG18_big_fil_WC_8_21_14_2_50_49_26]PIW17723.1 MAG: hypothetical protein COW36_07695 [bacterium (Candidatus Blackallbacteria) CG17_big_fil_post_rev_8_21_14_2_50_48_46]PIW47539.1 MAG: hypothetical protein COW20_12440 [bacterium (Candidatus Blackallbacteria) CG13_big_fil_rev_8_21_14_2_50_49_14]
MREAFKPLGVESIPGAWKNLHNGFLTLPLFASMLWLIFSLDASSFAVVEIVGVRLRELGVVVLTSLAFFVLLTWLHARRLLEEHGLAFRYDGRDDPAFACSALPFRRTAGNGRFSVTLGT